MYIFIGIVETLSSRLDQGIWEKWEKEGERDSSGALPLPVNHQAAEMVFAD